MNIWMWTGLTAVGTYLFASVPWGLIIGKINGIDIREHGSGNIGATNVRRVLGKFWGRLCFLLDFLKGFLPVLAVKLLAVKGIVDDPHLLGIIIASAAAVCGHMWSIYIGFKGGKGVSTSAGILLAVAPLSLLVSGLAWLAVFFAFRYVSLASICAAAILPVMAVVFSSTKIQPLPATIIALLAVLAILTIVRHRSNIQRLIAGTENRFERKKPGEIK